MIGSGALLSLRQALNSSGGARCLAAVDPAKSEQIGEFGASQHVQLPLQLQWNLERMDLCKESSRAL
ncbi:hypothetical protein GOP47_0018460 [Adiantum capillus-veneris]|uniref:Uncharacterized protein n=1 Tax=Adiantum capillus-veneris TaxID=13818 RepID=A0A9D4UEQ1_ADICA|nr:hypothetical protein GOP47_0018460 [Adiantum capillus-veneris]